jgi:hypothetical protein
VLLSIFMAPPFKMPLAKKSSRVPKSRSRGRGSVSNPRGRCAAGAQNPLDRIIDALPISEIQQQLTEEEEENEERRQSDYSNAALDDSTMELNMSSEVDEVDVVRLMRQCRCFK